jgi:type I restriction enzyme S subunit
MTTNWQTRKFEDCLDKVVYTRKVQRKDFLESGFFPVISQESEFINGYWNSEKDLFISKKPIVIFGDHTQVLKYVDFDFVLGADGVKILQSRDFLDSKFFYYFLQSVDLKNLGYARHYRLLKEKEVSFPSLPEQHRIVKILDEVFENIEKAKGNAEKNLQNSKELFESYLQSVFASLGKNWDEKRLEEVLQKTETIDPTKKPNEEFIYLDVSSVDKETKEIKNATLVMGKNAPSRARKIVKTGDVIFATVRPTHSRVALITEEYNNQVCSTGYFVLRTKELLNNNLVFYFLLTHDFNKQMGKLQKGASYPAVTDSEVKNIFISFPKSLSEQKAIVKKLDALAGETKRLEAIYKQKLADLDELKKSVLKKTFNGEL